MTDPTPAPEPAPPRKGPWVPIGIFLAFLMVGFVFRRGHRRHAMAGPDMAGPTAALRPPTGSPPTVAPLATTVNPNDPAAPLTPDERAILAPLSVGSTLGPATVMGIEGLRDGVLSVIVRVGNVRQTFRIARAAGSRPPIHAVGSYSVYMRGSGAEWPPNAIEPTWRALDAVLRNHLDLPVPTGLLPASEPGRVSWDL